VTLDEVNEWLMNPATWVVGGIEAIQRYMSITVEAAVMPRLQEASRRYDQQRAAGVPDEHLDVDSVMEESEFGRWVEICFFLGIFSFWESHVVELSEGVEPLSPREARLGRRTQVAIELLTRELNTPETRPSLTEIKAVRERLAHDGGRLTERGKAELSDLLTRGQVREANWEDIGFNDQFVNDAAAALATTYRAWSDQLRARN